VELRRALLLFALVLGLAAIATSFSRPADRAEETAPNRPPAKRTTPTVSPREESQQPRVISFSSTGVPRTIRQAAGAPAAISVEVARPGRVDLVGLGLTSAAEPLTPARFDVLENRPGRYEVRFFPAADAGEGRTVGLLEIVR
jgi:hypothetical protein